LFNTNWGLTGASQEVYGELVSVCYCVRRPALFVLLQNILLKEQNLIINEGERKGGKTRVREENEYI